MVWSEGADLGDRYSFSFDSTDPTSTSFEPRSFTYYHVSASVSFNGSPSSVSTSNYVLHDAIPFLKDCADPDDCILGVEEKMITYKIGDANSVRVFSVSQFSERICQVFQNFKRQLNPQEKAKQF